MENQGWIKTYRRSLFSSVWKNPTIWMVWSWLLLKAGHEDRKIPFNGVDLTLKKGDLITGTHQAIAEIPCLTEQKYRTAMKYLKSTGRITLKTNNKFSVVSIIKWKEYQGENTLTNKPLTPSQHPSNTLATTNNKDKKDKNDKKREISQTSKNSLTPCTTEKLKKISSLLITYL